MKKAFFVLLNQLMIISISATTGETNSPDSVQDSLIKRFLRFVPDSMAIESVINSDYKDEEIEESWILITKDVNAKDYEEAEEDDDTGFWNAENPYCRDHGSRGFVVLFKYKSGEYYKAVEDYYCLDSGEEDGGVYFPPECSIYLDKDGKLTIAYGHGRYGGWGCSFRYIDGEFKYIIAESSESRSWIADDLSTSYINYIEGIEEQSKIINANEVDDKDFVARYIYYTYDATPTYLLSISEVNHEEGRVRDPDIEYVNYRLLKIEVDDYKIVNGEKQWYRREITEEEAEDIDIQEY
ncbi:MAG: hypothetical protein J6Y11_03485 [Paludibacteraceae bacterium]|nr:hypothetical protein [Paludibacteraceae bacterium]